MLTKQDLNQIKKIVRSEVVSESETSQRRLRSEIKLSRIEVQQDIRGLTDRVKDVELQSKANGKGIKRIEVKFDELFDFLDKEHLGLVKRVKRVETHLNIQPLADF